MVTVETLLRDAIHKAGGPAALARELGLHRSEITEYEKGRRPIGPACVARIGAYLDLDQSEVRKLTLESVINGAKPAWQDRMRSVLFQLLAVGVVLSAASTNDAKALTVAAVDGLYIVAHWLRRMLRGFGNHRLKAG